MPRIEPVSDDLTMLTSPLWRANEEMMISGALPSVAFSKAPDGRAQVPGQNLGRLAHQPRQRDDRQCRGQEDQQWGWPRTSPDPVRSG